MANYVKATNFFAKDALLTGDPAKIIKGSEIDAEFNAISTAIGTKTDSNSPTFTGVPLAPTASAGTNNTQIATTAFAIANGFPAGGIIMWSGSEGTIPSGFTLCDGTAGTPDLRDRFVVGAGTGSSYSVGDTGGSKDAVNVSHSHSVSGITYTRFSSAAMGIVAGAGSVTVPSPGTSGWLLTGRNDGGGRSINFSTATTTAGGGTISTEGVTGTDANLPPYYALCYIMKL